jgi:hypothetical protein
MIETALAESYWAGLRPIGRRHETRAASTNARFENQAFQDQQISLQSAKGQLSRLHAFESLPANAVLHPPCDELGL